MKFFLQIFRSPISESETETQTEISPRPFEPRTVPTIERLFGESEPTEHLVPMQNVRSVESDSSLHPAGKNRNGKKFYIYYFLLMRPDLKLFLYTWTDFVKASPEELLEKLQQGEDGVRAEYRVHHKL